MAMRYKARKRLALAVLVIGLPAYVVIAVTVMSEANRLPKVLEFLVYVILGIGWAFPLKWVFKGIGQPDPDEKE